jgi:Arc/MetJ family transcription regulator
MKTTIEISDALISEAMSISNSKTKLKTIKKAFERIIQLEKHKKLIGFRGKIDLDNYLNVLPDRKDLI